MIERKAERTDAPE